MKKIGLCVWLFMLIVQAYAQDLIVTNQGDTLNCKITKQKKDFIHFTFKQNGEICNTLLPANKITRLQKNYFAVSEIKPEEISNVIYRTNYLRFAIDGGWGCRLGKAYKFGDQEYNDYIKKIKNGFQVGANIQHFWGEYFGAGLEYSLFKTSTSKKDMLISDQRSAALEDNIYIHFAAPTFNIRLASQNNKNSWQMGIGIGYLAYVDKAKIDETHAKISGSTCGMSYSLGYDLGLSEHVALGFKISVIGGTMDKIKVATGLHKETIRLDDDEKENLSHLTISVGIRFMGKS